MHQPRFCHTLNLTHRFISLFDIHTHIKQIKRILDLYLYLYHIYLYNIYITYIYITDVTSPTYINIELMIVLRILIFIDCRSTVANLERPTSVDRRSLLDDVHKWNKTKQNKNKT